MSFNSQSAFGKVKNISYCVGGKLYSATTNNRGDITQDKTGGAVKLIRGTCVTGKRNKCLKVSDQPIQTEGLFDFFKHIGKAAESFGKKILNIFLEEY